MNENLFEEIREICNHPWKKEILFQDKIQWNQLWTSLDVIEDSQLAINDYKELPEFNSYERGYLYVYGILQALFLQQDALSNLNAVLLKENLNFKEDYPDLYFIRESRNSSIGHPTNRSNGKSFHYIGRPSIRKKGFTMLSYFPKTGESSKIEEVDILSCIEIQEKLLSEIITKTITILKSEVKNHKGNFKGEKLADLIHPSMSYHFSKLYEQIYKDYPLIEADFETILDTYIKIKQGIIERYSSISALSGVELTVERLDYIFERLRRDLIDNKIEDQIELEVFVDSLKSHFEDLKNMVKEIDDEFE